MQMKLRTALLGALAGLVAAFLAVSAQAQSGVTLVEEGVYAFDPGDGYISMFVVTDDGVIAIESVNTQHATGFLGAIAGVTDQPVKYLLQSHNHWDHSAGGGVFREAGAKIVVHEEAVEWMQANPNPDMALPDEPWIGSKTQITLGGTTVDLNYLGMNHGLGMTVFVLPDQKVAYMADIVTPNRVMFAIVPDFNIPEWQRTLAEVAELDFDKAVFSHTNSGNPVGSKQDVIVQGEFIADLQGAIVAEFQKGTNPFAIADAVKLPKYADWVGYDQWLAMNTWRVMLDMWMGPFPWHAD